MDLDHDDPYDVPPSRGGPEEPPALPKKSGKSSFRDAEGLSRVSQDARPKPMPRKQLGRNFSSPVTSVTSPTSQEVSLITNTGTSSPNSTPKPAPKPRPRSRSLKSPSCKLSELQLEESFRIPPSADDVELMVNEMVMKELDQAEKQEQQKEPQQPPNSQPTLHSEVSSASFSASSNWAAWPSQDSTDARTSVIMETDFPVDEPLYINSGAGDESYYENSETLRLNQTSVRCDTQSSGSWDTDRGDGGGSGGVDDGFDSAFGGSDEDYSKVVRRTEVSNTGFESRFDPFQSATQSGTVGLPNMQPSVLQPTKLWKDSLDEELSAGMTQAVSKDWFADGDFGVGKEHSAGKQQSVGSEEKAISDDFGSETNERDSDPYEKLWFAQQEKDVQPGLVRPQSDLMAFSPRPEQGSNCISQPVSCEPTYGDRSGEYIGLDPTYNIPPPPLPPPPLPAQAVVSTRPPSIPPRPPNRAISPNPQNKFTFNNSSHITETSTDCSFDFEEQTSAVFKDLETPTFNPLPEDPFKYSGFDTECQKFNTPAICGESADSSIYEIGDTGDFVAEWPQNIGSESDSFYHQIGATGGQVTEVDPVRLSQVPPPPPRTRHGQPPSRPPPQLIRRETPSPRPNIYSFARTDDQDSTRSAVSAEGSDSSEDVLFDPGSDLNSNPGSGTLGRTSGQSGAISIVAGPTSPRKNERYGYLYKQGGVKANRGWRLRWVVFNGSDLRYYDNNRSQISKKIIPLSSMKEVLNDIKEGDTNRFKFRLVTTLRGRTFLFAADTRDDCCTWTNTLMSAILKYQTTAGLQKESEPKKPDKEGFIRFESSSNRQYYVAIWGKTLCYYDTFDDFQMNCPVHEIDMKLSSVKDKKKNKLQLSTHYAHFHLAFESPQEAQSWRMAIEDAIAEGLADDSVLEKVYENENNRVCADCEDQNPHWASINLGIVLCKKCAGIHRMFDTSVSKIRSLRMDTRVWTPSLIELMKEIGNRNANLFWEHDLMPCQKPHPDSLPEERKKFAQLKYQQRYYASKHAQAGHPRQLNEALLAVSSTSDLLELMKIVFSGADLSYTGGPNKETAYQISKRHGQRLLMELLYQNGGDCVNMEDDPEHEGRLREDVRLQGDLLKTGPGGRTFDQRWCVLEHGSLTYYLNEKSTTAKDSIDRKNMLCLYTIPSDRTESVFEISTTKGNNRVYTFAAKSDTERGIWMQTLGRLISPIAVMEHVGMMDFSLAALVYMRESVSEDWRSTWIMLNWRLLYYMNKDLKLDNIDLRKATQVRMQDAQSNSCPLCQERGSCFVLSSPGQTFYIQANLQRDTSHIMEAVSSAVKRSGTSLLDQQLTQDNVPVIVERCLTQIYSRGQREEGIYRKGATHSRVALLLKDLRADSQALRLDEVNIHEVASALKRFFRELEDSLFTRDRYSEWIHTAQIQDYQNKMLWYRYLLEKLPLVNYSTLKRIIQHIFKLAQMEAETKMNIEKLCTCFAPTLMCVETEMGPSNPGFEITVLTEIVKERDYLFQINQTELDTEAKIQAATQRILEIQQDPRKSQQVPGNFLMPVAMYSPSGQDEMVNTTASTTAQDVVDYLMRKCNLSGRSFALYEMLFKGAVVRPLFPGDNIMGTTTRWGDWEELTRNKDNVPCLCLADTDRLEKLDTHYDNSRPLFGELKYVDSRSKTKFKKTTVEFKQCMLTFYKDSKAKSQLCSWMVEELTIYIGVDPKRSPPTKYGFTFLVNSKEEKTKNSCFGHCVCLPSEEELYRWVAALLVAQNPEGLMVWHR